MTAPSRAPRPAGTDPRRPGAQRPPSTPPPAGGRGRPGRQVSAAAAPILAAIAEAAWISVFVAAGMVATGGAGTLGPLLPTVLAALAGVAAVRLVPAGPARVPALLGVTAGVVLLAIWVGRTWLTTGPGQPVLTYPLLGLAVLRGAAQAGDPGAGAGPIETLVRRAPALLGGGWVAGFIAAGSSQTAFVADAATCTLAFVVAAALAMGTGRLAALPEDDREQLRGNGPWLMVVLGIVGAALLVSVLTGGLLGGPLRGVPTGLAQLALSGVGVILGAILSVVVLLVDALATLLTNLFHVSPSRPPTPPPGDSGSQGPTVPPVPGGHDTTVEVILGIALIVGVVLVAWYLARRWQGARRSVSAPSGVLETRSISLDGRGALPPLRLAARLRERFAPSGALGAYPRLLHDWAGHPEVARGDTETPAAHAARLRSAGQGDLALDLLAADYELAAFGGVTLTPAEERRSVRRWRRLRRRRRVH